MIREKLEKLIDFLIEASLWVVVFFAPLYFSFFYKKLSIFFINPTLERLAILKIFVVFGMLLTLLKLFLKSRLSVYIKPKHLFVFLPFIVAIFLATLFSSDFHLSLRGSYVRQSGLITYLYYFLFVLFIFLNIKDKKQVERVINVVLISSFFVSLFGLAEWFGFNLVLRGALPVAMSRVSSTIGHPVFLGNYLLLVIFFSLYKTSIAKRFLYKFFWSLLVLLQFFTLIFTYSRGAWIGLVGGFVFGSFLWLFLNEREKFKSILYYSLLAIILVVSLGVFFTRSHKFSEPETLSFSQRIRSTFNLQSGSVAMRLKYWTGSVDAVARRPFLGYGPDNERSVLIKYYDPTWLVYESVNSFPDRAHNEYLDILIISGICGLFSFLFILSFIFWRSVLYFKSKGKDSLLFFSLVAIVAYQVALQFSFSTIETNIYFWLVVSVVFLLLSDFQENKVIDLTFLSKKIFYISLAILPISAVLVVLESWKNINEVRADYYYVEAKSAQKNGETKEMFNDYLKAINLDGEQESYSDAYALSIINSGALSISYEDGSASDVSQYLLGQLSDNLNYKNDFFKLQRSGIMATALGALKSNDYYSLADDYYSAALNINPFVPSVYKNQCLMYYRVRSYSRAIEACNKVIDVMPDFNNEHLNDLHRNELKKYLVDVQLILGSSYSQLGHKNDSLTSYVDILRDNPRDPMIYSILADEHLKFGDINQAIWYNERGKVLDNKNYFWYYRLAFLYDKNGDRQKSLENAKMVVSLGYNDDGLQKIIDNY